MMALKTLVLLRSRKIRLRDKTEVVASLIVKKTLSSRTRSSIERRPTVKTKAHRALFKMLMTKIDVLRQLAVAEEQLLRMVQKKRRLKVGPAAPDVAVINLRMLSLMEKKSKKKRKVSRLATSKVTRTTKRSLLTDNALKRFWKRSARR